MFSRAHEYISEAANQLVSAMKGLGDTSEGRDFATGIAAVPESLRATLIAVNVPDSAAEALGYLVRAVIARAFFDFATLLDGLDAPEGFEDTWGRVELARAREDRDAPLLHDAFCAAAGGGWQHKRERTN
ncbi:MAG: hypothetical protein AABM40_14920 [Chloroflexota bacterium]